MDLLNALMGAAGSGDLQKLGDQFGLDRSSVEKVLGDVVPALGRGMKKNTRSAGGLDSLLGALKKGGHERYLGNMEAVTSRQGIDEGNGILGHIFGNKDVSRNVAAHASEASGVSSDVIKKMLPMVATMVMGTMSKQTGGGQQVQALAGQQANQQNLLSSLLDSDKDGSVMDDVLDLAKRFF